MLSHWMNGARARQPVPDVSVDEHPRLRRDVVGEEQLLAPEGQRERGSTNHRRQLHSSGPVVVVDPLLRAGGDVDLGTSGVRHDPRGAHRQPRRGRLGASRRLVALSAFIRVRFVGCFLTEVDRRFGVARRLPEVDAGLVSPRLQQARFSTRLHVRRREPDEAEPVGVGEPVADPRLRVASNLSHVQLARADDRELSSPVDGRHVEHRVLRAVVGRLADELSHACREHPPVPDRDVRQALAQGREVGCV